MSLLCGLTLGGVNFVKVLLVDNLLLGKGYDIPVIAVICITLVLTVVIAKFVGCTLPILAKKIGFDPAVMASPFITTIVDAVSMVVFFNIAVTVLNI